MTAGVSRGMNGVTGASSRSSIWNITWTCCIASPARWPDRSRWSRGVRPDYGQPSFDRIWQALMERHGKQSGTRQMIDLLKLSQKHGHEQAAGGDRDGAGQRLLRCRRGPASC